MKKRIPENCFVKTRKLKQPQQSLQVSVTSYGQDDQMSNKYNTHDKTYGSSMLKSKLKNVSQTIDTMPRRQKPVLIEDYENVNPNYQYDEIKIVIHNLKKKDASNRLQISRLNKQLQLLAEEYSNLETQLKQKDEKLDRNNEYILKLDKQLRLYREQIGKNDRLKYLYSKIRKLQQENEQMRYVISEQLQQIQTFNHQQIEQDPQTEQIVKNINTYPSSQSDRLHPWEITMNPNPQLQPKEHKLSQQIYQPKQNHHLSTTMNENISYGNISDYINSRINELTSMERFNEYQMSKINQYSIQD